MKRIFYTSFLGMLFSVTLYSQSGSINNTLGTGGSFKVKSAASDSLLVVKENGSVGIGTSNPASTLDVNGQLTADQVKVDGIPSFFAVHIPESDLITGHVLATWNETTSPGVHDNSASFDQSTGQFVVPRDGFYSLTSHIELFSAGVSGAHLYVRVDGVITGLADYTPTSYSGASAMLSVAGVLKLLAGQTVTLLITAPDATPGFFSAEQGYFSGFLISDF
ncbi:MAG: hypothetical protein Q8L88_00370 [Bacteroidota bacterium]|nr:hypothetical protein [Bacteroidota bacterium]